MCFRRAGLLLRSARGALSRVAMKDWIDLAIAVGTVGAAVFAGIAARVAATSAEASRELVKLERERDSAAIEAAHWRQARRITVDVRGRQRSDYSDEPELEPNAWDASCVVTNASVDPIFNARIKIVCDDERWGPQLVGTLAPGQRIEVIARIMTRSPNLNGQVRFVDVEGQGWVADGQNPVRPDDDLTRWIDDGREFAERGHLPPVMRGTITRSDYASVPDFDKWERGVQDRPW